MPAQTPLELGLECLRTQKVDEAIQHLEQAATRFPEDHQGFNYLGVAYAKKGLYDRAIGAFQTALQVKSDIPSIHYNLGLAYQADGFLDKAREELQQALGIDPSYLKAVEALKALDTQEHSQNSLANQSCARHADEPAVDVCPLCQLPICDKCKTVINGKVLCTTCANQKKQE